MPNPNIYKKTTTMTFKDVLHIAAAFMIPLAAIEALQAWRTFRAVSEVQGLHLNPKKKKSKNKQNKPSKNSNNHDMNQNNNYQKTKSKRKIFQEKFLQKDKTSTKNRIDPKIENPELEADPITSSENDSFSSQTCDSENLIGPAGNNDTNNNTSTKNKQNNNNINEAIFFPELDKKPPCRDYYFHQKCQKRNCTESHDLNSSIGRLIMYIARSKSCIDVCQYTLSNKFLADAILARHRLGFGVVEICIFTNVQM